MSIERQYAHSLRSSCFESRFIGAERNVSNITLGSSTSNLGYIVDLELMRQSKPVRLETAPTVFSFGRHCFQLCRCGAVR